MREFNGIANTIIFDEELFNYQENPDGSKIISIDKNKRGFKITIEVTGDKEKHKKALQAVEDFYVNSSL